MSVRIRRYSATGPGDAGFSRTLDDTTREQRETVVDGYSFHWGPNEVRNFMDEGVGRAHGAFAPGANIGLDTLPTNQSGS